MLLTVLEIRDSGFLLFQGDHVDKSILEISFWSLLPAFGPVGVVVLIFLRWSLSPLSILYGTARMLLQLTLVGYVLTHIFTSDNPLLIVFVISIMLLLASWIALRPLSAPARQVYLPVLIAISTGGLLTLLIVTQGVIGLTPWFEPHYLVPLAGMIFANSMNAVSLAAERLESELARGELFTKARGIALTAALIPITNSLFAVGIVALPGMMTGQILSGVSPLIAARYQILVSCMVFGSAGISSAVFLMLMQRKQKA